MSYQPGFLDKDSSQSMFDLLLKTVSFEQKTIVVWGRPCQQHRLIAYYGSAGCAYSYSGLTLQPVAWIPELQRIAEQVNAATQGGFNSCLLNYYRDGADYISFHADNERELGNGGCVAMISLGASRRFVLKRCSDRTTVELSLEAGSLVVMNGDTQRHWQHSLPATSKLVGPRISLTFRQIRPAHGAAVQAVPPS